MNETSNNKPILEIHGFDSLHRNMIQESVKWIVDKRVYLDETGTIDVSESNRRSIVASTFTYFCSPPDAKQSLASVLSGDSMYGYYLTWQFLFVFFILDEAKSVQEARSYREIVRRFSQGIPISPSTQGEIVLLDFLNNLNLYLTNTTVFMQRLGEITDCFVREMEISNSYIDEKIFSEIRRDSVAVKIFSALWEVIAGLKISPEERALADHLHDIACELQWIVNDIGSLKRDSGQLKRSPHDRQDPNIVLVIVRERGLTIQEAKEILVLRHNGLVVEFNREYQKLRSYKNRDMARYVDALARSINGNLATTLFLNTVRYTPEPELALFRQVHEVFPLFSS